ncbi:MAG: phosphonate ABC transporter ATP-binding protein [Planctomycetota bacterium]|jgi:phosphonate transport system ATP-binding protein
MNSLVSRFLLDRVTVAYGEHRAVDNVSLRVEPGELVGIVGPSGAGKTTLLRLLIGAIRPDAGAVAVDGAALPDLSARELRALRSRIGFVHQDHRLLPNQRVVTNVVAGRLGRWSLFRSIREVGWPRRDEVQAIHGLLQRVGIPEKLYQRVDSLSGGQLQRVAIARALYQEPEALLADEPVASVDPARARDTVALITRIAREEGLTLCVSLHNLDLAREYFPRLVGMRGGRIVFDCQSADLSDHDFRELYALTAEEILQDA